MHASSVPAFAALIPVDASVVERGYDRSCFVASASQVVAEFPTFLEQDSRVIGVCKQSVHLPLPQNHFN
jgi:hypothetical protein